MTYFYIIGVKRGPELYEGLVTAYVLNKDGSKDLTAYGTVKVKTPDLVKSEAIKTFEFLNKNNYKGVFKDYKFVYVGVFDTLVDGIKYLEAHDADGSLYKETPVKETKEEVVESVTVDGDNKPLPEAETDVFVGEAEQESPAIIPYELYHEMIHSGELANKCGKNLTQAIFKMMEELGELTSSLEAMGSYKKGKIEDVHEEIMDVLQCATSIYVIAQKEHAFDGAAILKAKNDKWEKLYLKKKEVKE